jgi:RND superfamily putative drug exporter
MSRIARFVLRNPRKIVAFWALLLLVSGVLATQLDSRLRDGGYEVPGSSSERANQLSRQHFPEASRQRIYAAVVTDEPSRAQVRAAGRRAAAAVRGVEGVERVEAPIAAPDGQAALVPVVLAGGLAEAQTYVSGVQAALDEVSVRGGSAQAIGQAAVYDRYMAKSKEGLQLSALISFPVMLAILLVAFLSVTAALVPLALASVCVGVTFGGLFLISYLTNLNVFVEDTALVLGLGLSIDFSLFMVTRVREALAAGAAGTEAAVTVAMRTTGRAVLISGLTIVVALAGLFVVGAGVFASLAMGAIVAGLIAVAATLTLAPAVLVLLGDRLERFPIKVAASAARNAALWRRLGAFVVRRRVAIVAVTVPLMLLMALPVTGMHIALRNISVLPGSDPVRGATDDVGRSFGPGASTPAFVVARTASPRPLAAVLERQPGVASVGVPETGEGGWVRVTTTLDSSADSAAAAATVDGLRSSLGAAFGPTVSVGGSTAEGNDLVDRIDERTPAVAIVVLLAEMLLLTLVFRAPLIALKAALTTLLSVGAALGLMALIFSGAGGIHFIVPLFTFAIVFGLSTDYEVFFISRVREYHQAGHSTADSVTQALVRSARSITLAGTTMTVVFFAFALSPLGSSQELGVAMGLGVLLDVTLVRGLLVPATIALLGERNWWYPRLPSPLAAKASQHLTVNHPKRDP